MYYLAIYTGYEWILEGYNSMITLKNKKKSYEEDGFECKVLIDYNIECD